MRNDLTTNFLAKMAASTRAPIQLVVFHFPSIGDKHYSDRDIIIGGQEYIGLVENWGVLGTAGYGVNDIISETLELTLTLWNGGLVPFSNYFLVDEPTNVQVDVYQTFEGLEDIDKALIGQFVIQDPIGYAESSRLLSLDLVSPNMRYTANIGAVLTTASWPNALESDLNKGIDLIVGDAGEVKTLCARTPLSFTMKGSILKLPTIINSYENLDDLDFPQSGAVVIDDEILLFTSRDSDTLIISTRGIYSTLASDHSDGVTVLEYITDHTYIIGKGPLSTATEIKAGPLGNRLVDPDEYTLDLVSDPATITFSKQPAYISYPKGARSTDVDFDITVSGNTAYQPHYSYDPDSKALGAIINATQRSLIIANNELGIDEGEVVRVFLLVEHWATKFYSNDQAIAYVDGIGEIGRLSRPNASDIIEVGGDVDLDHGHGHRTGGTHDHSVKNPNVSTYNPSHGHNSTIQGPEVSDGGSVPLTYSMSASSSTLEKSKTFYYNGQSNIQSQRVYVRFYARGLYYVKIYTGYRTYSWDATNGISVAQSLSVTNRSSLKIVISRKQSATNYINIYECTLYTQKSSGISNQVTGITAEASGSEAYAKGSDTSGYSIKDSTDVSNLIRANEPINITSTETSSKKVTDKFDITKHLETADWNWLVNRKITISYTGSNDSAHIFITYVNFLVEYRQRQTIITNDIFCKPVGSIENRPDAVLQYILNNIAGIPLDSFGSIWAQPNTWRDTDIWDDTSIWIDNGEQLGYPPGAAFQEAGARYAFLRYRLDGVISANETVQNVAKEICRQARGRLLWSAGEIKLAVREKLENWVTLKSLEQEETQLRSISVSKEPITTTYNDIDLFYSIDRKSTALDESQYNATASLIDAESVNQHGQRKDNSQWLFDLVRDESMALDLVDYYLWRHGQPITKYAFNVYLQQFDTEKDDTIRLTSNFSRMNKLPMRISNNARDFGSGKTGRINTIQLVGESIRHNLELMFFDDSVMVVEDIEVTTDKEHIANDSPAIVEQLFLSQTTAPADNSGVTDQATITAIYTPNYDYDLTVADSLAVSHSAVFDDSVILSDSVVVSYEPCFGACGFGGQVVDDICNLPFGAPTVWYYTPDTDAGATDEFTMAVQYSVLVEDSATVSDSIFVAYLLKETVSVSEELIFNSCFGAPVEGSTGFGLNNFGK